MKFGLVSHLVANVVEFTWTNKKLVFNEVWLAESFSNQCCRIYMDAARSWFFPFSIFKRNFKEG